MSDDNLNIDMDNLLELYLQSNYEREQLHKEVEDLKQAVIQLEQTIDIHKANINMLHDRINRNRYVGKSYNSTLNLLEENLNHTFVRDCNVRLSSEQIERLKEQFKSFKFPSSLAPDFKDYQENSTSVDKSDLLSEILKQVEESGEG